MWRDNPRDDASPVNGRTNALAASVLASGKLRVYGFTVYSSLGNAQFVLVFDASALPADGIAPIVAIPVAASSPIGVYYGAAGRVFDRGIVLCNSTTDTVKTIGLANCLFDVQYDYLH